MKKQNLLFLFLLFSCYCSAQNEFVLKVKYKPETVYHHTIEQAYSSYMEYDGPEQVLESIKSQGISNPDSSRDEFTVKSVLKTGKLKGGTFPLVLEVLETNIRKGQTLFPAGTLIYGHGKIGEIPIYDSIVSGFLGEKEKLSMLESIQMSLEEIFPPEKKVKIGDKVSKEIVQPHSFGSSIVNTTNRVTYTLISVTNGIAHFEIETEYVGAPESGKESISFTGKGKGFMDYEIAKNFYIKFRLASKVEFKGSMDPIKIFGRITTDVMQTTILPKE